jgi:hypothetical protein
MNVRTGIHRLNASDWWKPSVAAYLFRPAIWRRAEEASPGATASGAGESLAGSVSTLLTVRAADIIVTGLINGGCVPSLVEKEKWRNLLLT